MCENMGANNGKKRIKTFTLMTSDAISHTLRGLIDLTSFLLEVSKDHQFVMLGDFSTDPLEKAFGKLRQGSGGVYFISAQQAVQKMHIYHAKLLLRFDADFSDCSEHHNCVGCSRKLTEAESEIFDMLDDLEVSMKEDSKMGCVYVAGYIVHKTEIDHSEDTFEYFDMYGRYLKELNRGGLKIPGDTLCQWVFFCYILFMKLDMTSMVCRKSVSKYFKLVNKIYFCHALPQVKICSKILSNILINNYTKLATPRSKKEPAQKLLKLQFE